MWKGRDKFMAQAKETLRKLAKQQKPLIVIFPYFFIHEKDGFEVEGYKIKPAYLGNLSHEDQNMAKHLLKISRFFKHGGNENISLWSYLIASFRTRKEFEKIKRDLDKLTNILRYSKLRDLRGTHNFEQFNYCMFVNINQSSAIDEGYSFYEGILNGESPLSFTIIDGNPTNFYQPNQEIHPFTFRTDEIINDEYFQVFYKNSSLLFNEKEDKKILRAIEWFNRSFSHDGRGVDLSEAILNVHTALEALLRPQDENRDIKAQIKTALINLLGHSKEVDAWFNSFWKLRNAIVHGDLKPDSFMYTHPESKDKKGHRHQHHVARKIFVKCLDAILKIRADFPLIGLEDELVSNEIRINQAISLLKKNKSRDLPKLYEKKGCFQNIHSLRADEASASKEKVRDLGLLLLPYVKEELNANVKTTDKQPSIDAIEEILAWKGNDFGELSRLYNILCRVYKIVYFQEAQQATTMPFHVPALRNATYHFLNFATWRFITLYR